MEHVQPATELEAINALLAQTPRRSMLGALERVIVNYCLRNRNKN